MTRTLRLADVPPAFRRMLDRLRREDGEIVITDGECPVARVTPLRAPHTPGVDKGPVTLAPDFEEPLPDPSPSGDWRDALSPITRQLLGVAAGSTLDADDYRRHLEEKHR